MLQIYNWLICNRLVLNYNKSNFMMMGQPKSEPNINVFIGQKSINRVFSSNKILGITIDRKLHFNKHINNLYENLNKKISLFSRLRYHIPKQTAKLAFEALIFPILDYGIVVYGFTMVLN